MMVYEYGSNIKFAKLILFTNLTKNTLNGTYSMIVHGAYTNLKLGGPPFTGG